MIDGNAGAWFPAGVGADSAAHQLFCFPQAGGGARFFRPWEAELAPGIKVVPVQLPGRESRFGEPLLTSAAAVVAAVLEPLSACARGSFALFGHSMGALLAYETTVALADRGLPPARLFASGHRPPHRPDPAPASRDLTDREIAQRLADYGAMPAEVLDDPDMMEFLMPRFRADFEIRDTYRYVPGPPVPVPVTVFAGREDPAIDVGELGRWGELTTRGVDVHVLDGGHSCHVGLNGVRVRAIVAASLEGAGRR